MKNSEYKAKIFFKEGKLNFRENTIKLFLILFFIHLHTTAPSSTLTQQRRWIEGNSLCLKKNEEKNTENI
jgi:hypothetical protein